LQTKKLERGMIMVKQNQLQNISRIRQIEGCMLYSTYHISWVFTFPSPKHPKGFLQPPLTFPSLLCQLQDGINLVCHTIHGLYFLLLIDDRVTVQHNLIREESVLDLELQAA